jgi:hypothetical protein
LLLGESAGRLLELLRYKDDMYVKSKYAQSVSVDSLLKAFWYTYLSPKTGYYDKLRSRFGSRARLMLNSEMALDLVLRNLPTRQPGMQVLVDASRFKRFEKVIKRLGLRPIQFDGERQLLELADNSHVLAIVIPDSYSVMHRKNLKIYDALPLVRILYQNRKRPKQVDLTHDVYIWEPKHLPRSSSGAVVVVANDRLLDVDTAIKEMNSQYPRMVTRVFIKEIYKALRGHENRYRRIDRRPPKVLARMLYDFYK